jgi:predicted permease
MEMPPTFFELFFAIIPLFLVGVMGFYFRKHGGMLIHADETILWLLLNLFTPCLIIDSFLGNKSLDNIGNLISAPILGFCTVVIGIVSTRIAGHFLHLNKKQQQGSFDLTVALYNYGYIPIPIILLFFGKDVLGMLFVYNVGMELSLWTLGFLVLTGHSSLKESLKRAINPPLLAIVLSLIANAYFLENPLPLSLARVIHMIGQATIPMALLLVGATIFDHAPSIRTLRPLKPVVAGVALRLLILPAIFVAMAYLLPVPPQLKTVLCVQAGMPSAVLPIVLIRQYGGDLQLAIRIIVATSVLCLLTMPAWISLAL